MGPHTSTIIVDSVSISKSEKDWDEYDKKQAQLNAKVMNILYCTLDVNKFNRISIYLSIKKI